MSNQSKRPPFIPTCKSVVSFDTPSAFSFNTYTESSNKNTTNPEGLKKIKSKEDLGVNVYDKFFDYDENRKVMKNIGKQSFKKKVNCSGKCEGKSTEFILNRIKSQILTIQKCPKKTDYEQDLNYQRKGEEKNMKVKKKINACMGTERKKLRKKNIQQQKVNVSLNEREKEPNLGFSRIEQSSIQYKFYENDTSIEDIGKTLELLQHKIDIAFSNQKQRK